MVDNYKLPGRYNTSLLRKLVIILLIIPALVISHTLIQTPVAFFYTASNHHRDFQLTSDDGTDSAAYRGDIPVTNISKETSDLENDSFVVKLEEYANETNVTPKHPPTANNEPTAVILLTYMRSGSSLTGDILQQAEDAFYVFEPLKNTRVNKIAQKTIHFINGTSMLYGENDLQWIRVFEETLYGWLTCDLSRVYGESLLDVGFLAFGHKFRRYRVCIGRFRGLFGRLLKQNELHKNARFIECLNMLQHICSTSKFRIVKTIRTPMEVAKSLIYRIPNSKILHLVRDPRATIESKRHTSRCNTGLTLCIAEHCDNVRKDTAVKQSIKSKAPERISNVLYEDIASRPIATAQKMYSFVGMDFTETIANYVYNITLGYNKKGCRVCLVRWQLGRSHGSSVTHIAAWKDKLPGKFINQTQIICKDVIENYGYEEYRAPPHDSKV